jgi:hypothetical protein
MDDGTRERPFRARIIDVAVWAILTALTAVAVYLGRFWFVDSWLQPTAFAALTVALLVGFQFGADRARPGSPRRAEAVRYGLLFAMLLSAAVGVVLLAWTLLVFSLLGGWAA